MGKYLEQINLKASKLIYKFIKLNILQSVTTADSMMKIRIVLYEFIDR